MRTGVPKKQRHNRGGCVPISKDSMIMGTESGVYRQSLPIQVSRPAHESLTLSPDYAALVQILLQDVSAEISFVGGARIRQRCFPALVLRWILQLMPL